MQLQDLAKLYETKTREELLELAADSAQLTPEANTALAVELAKRRIDVSEELNAHQENDQSEFEPPKIHRMPSLQSHEVGDFVAKVLRVYHLHFWLFVEIVGPAVVVGYFAVYVGRQEVREIVRHFPRGVEHPTELLEVWSANLAGYFVSWIAFSFSFGAICTLLRQIEAGDIPSIADSFTEVRKRASPLLRLSVLLFFLCLIAFGASFLFSMGVLWLSIERHLHLSGFTIWVSSFTFTGLALLVLSRFALAVPAVILDNYKVGQAMFRSDELTEGRWLTLAALLSKSLIGGYVAGMCPFWLASLIPDSAPLPSWFPWVLASVSMAAVTVVEPTMFIGFVLLYRRMSAMSSTQAKH